MIDYNNKSWFALIFQFHKSDTFRKLLPVILGICIYTTVLVYLETEVLHLKYESTNMVHSLLGFVISLLLVFRTNTAYERWWEGRKQWGALVNHCRNLGIKMNAYLSDELVEERKQYATLVSNFAVALKEHLRDGVKMDELESCKGVDLNNLQNKSHIPNHLASDLVSWVDRMKKEGHLTEMQTLHVNDEIKGLTDVLGACERIKNTPIPYSYSLFLKKFLFIYVMTIPIAFIATFGYWSTIIVSIVFYVLASLELIAEEIEDPFGTDANDLPTDSLALKIKANVHELMVKQ